jgi:hypothetical protein
MQHRLQCENLITALVRARTGAQRGGTVAVRLEKAGRRSGGLRGGGEGEAAAASVGEKAGATTVVGEKSGWQPTSVG